MDTEAPERIVLSVLERGGISTQTDRKIAKNKIGINTLADYSPFLSSQWSPLNDCSPDQIRPFSNRYAFWQCSRGHTWKSRINNRVLKQTGCPYCSGKMPIVGENDLKSLYPALAEQWHSTRNDSKPEEYLPKSNKKVWWHCPVCGKDWKAAIHHRVEGTGCPYCDGKRPIPGKTDFKTLYPVLALQWDDDANGSCRPENYTTKSHHRAHWICDKGHTWEASIEKRVYTYERLSDKSKAGIAGCPVCNGKKVVVGENDLLTVAPELASQWDYEKNTIIQPDQVTLHSNTPVWWKCEKGHSWKVSPNNRSANTGCPFCNNNRLLPKENSLLSMNPVLAEEWDQEKNAPITASDVTQFNNHAFWWKCKKGHSWNATVSNRSNGEGCPYCASRRAIPGVNSFDVQHPELVKQWHPIKNGTRTPSDFLPGSNIKAWWQCEKGHEWTATVFERVNGSGCPKCKGAKLKNRSLV